MHPCIYQDYLGAAIVFIAVQTALISSHLLPDEVSASLIGLSIQYTLMIPIYLNWVVKLYAEVELYFGACERISCYIDNTGSYHEREHPANGASTYLSKYTYWYHFESGWMAKLFILWRGSFKKYAGGLIGGLWVWDFSSSFFLKIWSWKGSRTYFLNPPQHEYLKKFHVDLFKNDSQFHFITE